MSSVLDRLAKIVEFDGAVRLAAVHGNSNIALPKGRMADAHPLVALLGREKAERLQAEWPELTLAVPACHIFSHLRMVAIAYHLAKSGGTENDIAQRLGVNKRTARGLLQTAAQVRPRYKQRGGAGKVSGGVVRPRGYSVVSRACAGDERLTASLFDDSFSGKASYTAKLKKVSKG